MSTPIKRWEENSLQNSTQLVKNANIGANLINVPGRNAPVLPPRPSNSSIISSGYNSYIPYSGMSYGGYNGYGSSYGSYGMPYRSSLYNSYGSSYGGYNNYGLMGNGLYPNFSPDDHERRFIQYAEESSRNTFANVESIVRAFNSIAMMLDNTFFAMTSSFRAVLSVAENFGRLRTMFSHIWYSVNIFRFLSWLYKKIMQSFGFKISHSVTSVAWKEASHGLSSSAGTPGSSWPTIAFLGMLVSAPYIISKFLPKYEDKGDPAAWKSPGIRAKAVFDFVATAPNELTIQTNDNITLAPTYIQDEMNLKNSGWAFAICRRKSGVVPLNYLVISKNKPLSTSSNERVPITRATSNINNTKSHTKRVSFGETQVFENIDIDDYNFKNECSVSSHVNKDNKSSTENKSEIKQDTIFTNSDKTDNINIK